MYEIIDGKYVEKMQVPISRCDCEGKLSLPDIAAMYMDIASCDAERRGVGVTSARKDEIIWITVRARYRFFRMPEALENITLSTWPGQISSPKCFRCYTIHSGDELCSEGQVEWCLFNYVKNKIAFDLPEKFLKQTFLDEKVCLGDRAVVDKNFSLCPLLGEYTVESIDIDSARHMNNVAYIRKLFGLMTTKQLSEMKIDELEIAYLTPTMEGETVKVYERKTEFGSEYGVIKTDGKITALIRMKYTIQ